jgi:hypothetical protein
VCPECSIQVRPWQRSGRVSHVTHSSASAIPRADMFGTRSLASKNFGAMKSSNDGALQRVCFEQIQSPANGEHAS